MIKTTFNFHKLLIFSALAALLIVIFSNCSVSLRSASIEPTIKTFHIELLENKSSFVEPTLALNLTEALKDYIRNNSRLDYNPNNPDIIFSGDISTYRISSEAPQAGATTGFNKLTIGLRIDYEDVNDENKNWKKTFSRFENFSAEADFASVSDGLNTTISEYLAQDVFNEAFAKNW